MADPQANPDDAYGRIRSPGRIQTFGVLLTAHPRTLRILNASDNAASLLGIAVAELLGRRVDTLFDDPVAGTAFAETLTAEPFFVENPVLVQIGGRLFDAVAHQHDNVLFLELEPLAPGAPTRAHLDLLSNRAIEGMLVPGTIDELFQAGPAAIRAATGFDRVLLYRFDDRFNGQVVGESRRDGVDSFFGLFFPESDIGAPARQLYTHSFCRYIPNITHETARILPQENPLTARPLDLSYATLRSVLGCHVEYLENMGVAASMSFSIVSQGKLWGLFACHHYQPSRLSYTQRLVCEQVAMMFVARLEDLVRPEAIEAELEERRQALLAAAPLLARDPLVPAQWDAQAEEHLMRIVNADGAAIYVDGRVGEVGECPDLLDFHQLIDVKPDEFDGILRRFDEDGLFYTNSSVGQFPFGERLRDKACGLLIVPVSRRSRRYLMWFRPEQVRRATWAGNPNDSLIRNPDASLSPRKSFSAWKETIRDKAEPWTEAEIRAAVRLRDALLAQEG